MKFHAVITSEGQLVKGLLTSEPVYDVKAAAELVEEVIGCVMIADQGYDRSEGTITNRKEEIAYDQEQYKKRGL